MKQNPIREREEAVKFPRAFILLMAAGLAIRLAVLTIVAGVPLVSDAEDYREMAMRLVAGEHFVPYWPPGVSLYLTPFVASGASLLVLRAVMLGWWVLFSFGLARLAEDLKIKRSLWLTLLAICCVAPAYVHFSIEPMTQMPAAALLVWGLSATVRCTQRSSWREAVLLGVSSGYLSLVRPSAMPLLLLLPAVVLWKRRQVAQPVYALALASAMLLGWAGYAHELCGRWMINSSNGINLFYGNNPWTPLYRTWYFGSHAKPGTEEIHEFPEYERQMQRVNALPQIDRSEAFEKLAVDYITANPGTFVRRTINRARCYWGFDIFTAANIRSHSGGAKQWFLPTFLLDAFCYLAIAGFAAFWIAAASGELWKRWQTWLLSGVTLMYALPYWISMSHPSYHFPVLVPVAMLGCLAFQSEGHIVRWRGWFAVAILGLIQLEWVYFLSRN